MQHPYCGRDSKSATFFIPSLELTDPCGARIPACRVDIRVDVWQTLMHSLSSRLNACPTMLHKALILRGGAGGFACESAH